ncbi:cell division inhibitor protein, partial [Escherichia coli]|nr:cell division inhibitor protein [Escherichia coli]
MVHQHYGTQTVNRGAVMPGMLVKHKDGTWTASANLRGRLYLHRGIERTYT